MATEAKYEMYDPKKIDAVYQNLMALKQRGVEKAYEILIDNFAVIPHTIDLERFMEYSNFISPESRMLAIHIFKGNSQSDKYFFYLNPVAYKDAVELKGIGPKPQTEDKEEIREQIRKELHYEELIEENAQLKKDIQDYIQIIEVKEKEVQDVKKNRDLGLSGIGSLLIEGALKSKTVREAVPFLGNLSGMQDEQSTPEPDTTGNASFKRKEKNVDNMEDATEVEEDEYGQATYRITDKERRYILFIEDIRHRIGDIELANIMHLLDLLSSNTRAIPYAIRHTTNFLKMDQQHQQQNSKNNDNL